MVKRLAIPTVFLGVLVATIATADPPKRPVKVSDGEISSVYDKYSKDWSFKMKFTATIQKKKKDQNYFHGLAKCHLDGKTMVSEGYSLDSLDELSEGESRKVVISWFVGDDSLPKEPEKCTFILSTGTAIKSVEEIVSYCWIRLPKLSADIGMCPEDSKK